MIDAVDDHRTELKDLAESNLPCDWIAKALLEEASETGA